MRTPQSKSLVAAAELRLEALDAACGVNKALLTGIGGMRVGSYVAHNNKVFNPVDGFLLLGAHRGLGQKLAARGYVHKAHGMVIGMDVLFHRESFLKVNTLPLTRFEAGIGLVDNVDAPFAAHHLTIRVAAFERLDRAGDFHDDENEMFREKYLSNRFFTALSSVCFIIEASC